MFCYPKHDLPLSPVSSCCARFAFFLALFISVSCETRKLDKGPDSVENQIRQLIDTIDDDHDLIHADYTPSVHRLIEIGEPAIIPTLDLMLSDDRLTRMRAQNVLHAITRKLHGFSPGHGWRCKDGEEKWKRFWAGMGDLDWEAPKEQRIASVARWKEKWAR
jgi:hypothetical protein